MKKVSYKGVLNKQKIGYNKPYLIDDILTKRIIDNLDALIKMLPTGKIKKNGTK